MKIITRDEMLLQHRGLVYQKYEPYVFHGMYIRGATTNRGKTIGFMELNLINNIHGDSLGEIIKSLDSKEGIRKSYDEYDNFDDDDQLYVVQETEDLIKLIDVLVWAKHLCIGQDNKNTFVN